MSKGGQQQKTFVKMSQSKHAQQYTIYTLPRKFRDDAKLHPFLAEKCPDLIKLNKREYTLYDVSMMAKSNFQELNEFQLFMNFLEHFRFYWVWDKWFQRRGYMTPIIEPWLSLVQGLKQPLKWNLSMSLKSGINFTYFIEKLLKFGIF